MSAFKLIFTRQLRLKRGEQGLRVVFEDTAAPEQAAAAPQKPSQDPSLLMRSELQALLDKASGSRNVVRHLAAIEHTLARRDPTGLFIFEQPAPRVKTTLVELDMLAGNDAGPGLVALRNLLGAAIAAHAAREREAQNQQPISSFLTDDKLEVNEVRHSDFDKASADWFGQTTAASTSHTPR